MNKINQIDYDMVTKIRDGMDFQKNIKYFHKKKHPLWDSWMLWYFDNNIDDKAKGNRNHHLTHPNPQKIINDIGLDYDLLNIFIENKIRQNQLDLNDDFYQLVFHFLYDRHVYIIQKKAHVTPRTYLHLIGLNNLARKDCLHKNNLLNTKQNTKLFQSVISYVYQLMVYHST